MRQTITWSFDVGIARSWSRWNQDSKNFTHKASVSLYYSYFLRINHVYASYHLIGIFRLPIWWTVLINYRSLKNFVVKLSRGLPILDIHDAYGFLRICILVIYPGYMLLDYSCNLFPLPFTWQSCYKYSCYWLLLSAWYSHTSFTRQSCIIDSCYLYDTRTHY